MFEHSLVKIFVLFENFFVEVDLCFSYVSFNGMEISREEKERKMERSLHSSIKKERKTVSFNY